MKLLDLSQPLFDGAPNCPDHPPVRVLRIASHEKDGWQLEFLEMALHSGSHIDAPLHKLAGGMPINAFALEDFVLPAWVVDFRGINPGTGIFADHLKSRLPSNPTACRGSAVLLATGQGDPGCRGHEDWKGNPAFLHPEGARYLVDRGVRAVGIDHFSLGGCQDDQNRKTHEIVLGAGLWIVEELFFPPEVFSKSGPFVLWALPINFIGASGAFCRPVLVWEDS